MTENLKCRYGKHPKCAIFKKHTFIHKQSFNKEQTLNWPEFKEQNYAQWQQQENIKELIYKIIALEQL